VDLATRIPTRFRPNFEKWKKALSQTRQKDLADRLQVFAEATCEIAHCIPQGLHRGLAASELFNMAFAYDLDDVDQVQAIIGREFGAVEEPKTNGTATPQQNGLDILDAGDDPGVIEPRPWLLGNQFCSGFISSIVAAGGTGKTALRLLQLVSLAVGRPLCGQYVFKRCRVLLISLEDDRVEMQRRIQALLNYYNIDRKELKGWLYFACPKLSKLALLQDRKLIVGPLENQLRQAIERFKPDIISLDPFIKTHSLPENNSTEMDFVCDLLARIAIEFEIALDSPHHVHKGTITPGDADAGRGSSGIRDAARLLYTLTTMTEEEAAKFNIDADERAAYIRLDAAKVNIAARTGKATWFKLIGVPLHNGTPKYPNGDTIQVAEPWTPPGLWADLDVELLNRILTEIAEGLDDGNYYSDGPNVGDRAAWQVVHRLASEKSEAQCREVIRAWIDSGLLVRFDYRNPQTRKKVFGLKVDDAKRPQ
jgi:AAA domain-containing protein